MTDSTMSVKEIEVNVKWLEGRKQWDLRGTNQQ